MRERDSSSSFRTFSISLVSFTLIFRSHLDSISISLSVSFPPPSSVYPIDLHLLCTVPASVALYIFVSVVRYIAFYPSYIRSKRRGFLPTRRGDLSMKQKERREGEGDDDDGDRRTTVGGGLESFSPPPPPSSIHRSSTARNHYPGNVARWISLIIDMRRRRGREQFNYGNGMLQRTSPRYPISFHGGSAASSYSLLTTANPGRNANCS